jgi:hypothetical protein
MIKTDKNMEINNLWSTRTNPSGIVFKTFSKNDYHTFLVTGTKLQPSARCVNWNPGLLEQVLRILSS